MSVQTVNSGNRTAKITSMKTNRLGSTRAEHPTGTLLASRVPMTTNVPGKWNGQRARIITADQSSCFNRESASPGNLKSNGAFGPLSKAGKSASLQGYDPVAVICTG